MQMAKILFRLFLLVLPALMLLGYLEHRLSRLDTHYVSKRVFFEAQEKDIQILTLGSSNAYFGINPAKFSCTGFNMAINAQSMYYDWKFVEKYSDRLPNLKMVVLPAIFYTAGSDFPSTNQSWREFFYKQYFGFSLEVADGKWFSLKQSIDARNFTKIALYGDTLYDHIRTKFQMHVDYVPEKTGWYDSSSVGKPDLARRSELYADVVANAVGNSRVFSAVNMERNLLYWQKIVDHLKERKIQILIVHLPEDRPYHANYDPKKYAEFKSAFREFAAKNNLYYRDYTDDARFHLDDMTFMLDHMNPAGAAKFGTILNQDFIAKACG
jgi:hypothetical protein